MYMYYTHLSRLVPGPLSWYAAALIWKAFPLDMSQYDRLFNNTRVPEIDKDCLLSFKHEAPKHLVVMRNGQFYSIDVVQEDGEGLWLVQYLWDCLSKHQVKALTV